MFGAREREIFARLDLPYPAVAVRFCRNRPEGYEQVGETDHLCCFLKRAQEENRAFYITIDNEDCMGKVVLGMLGLDSPDGANHASGNMGRQLGAFRTPAANARLYYNAPMFKRDTVNFVLFCPVSLCSFHPDLVLCVADTERAQLLLRASSYSSGDVWESKCSYVMSCAWAYVYPYVSGKVNHLFTGMHFGMRMKGVYPPGLHIISIPYQKLDEVVTALYEMEWDIPFLRQDPESKQRLEALDRLADRAKHDIQFPLPVD